MLSSMRLCSISNTTNLKRTVSLMRTFSTTSVMDSPSTSSQKSIEEKFRMPKRFDSIDKYSVWNDFIHLALHYKPLNLGQGFPDFAPPEYLTKTLKDIAQSDDYRLHQYTRIFGKTRLVNVLADVYSRVLERRIDPNTEVYVAAGALMALYAIIAGNVGEGDEVIIIEPFFEVYQSMVKMSGGKIRYVPLRLKKQADPSSLTVSSGDYALDPDELAGAFNSKTKAIIFNTPNNPLGKVFNMDEMMYVADLCKKWNVLCISDEVYEWLVFPPDKHIRMATLPGMWNRTVTIGSAGKTFSVTGWKVGWAVAPEHLLRNMHVVGDIVVNSANVPMQEAIAIAFEKELKRIDRDDCYFYSLGRELLAKRDYLVKTFTDIGMKAVVPQGGYFILADFTNWESRVDLSEEKDQFKDSRFCKWMTKNVGVMGLPSTVFYGDNKKIGENVVRYCFVKNQDYLEKIDSALRNFYNKNFK